MRDREPRANATGKSIIRRLLGLVFNDTVIAGIAILAVCAFASVGIAVLTWFVYRRRYEIEIGFFDYVRLIL